MVRGLLRGAAVGFAAVLTFFAVSVPQALGQSGTTGAVTITVIDPSGSVVPDAELSLRDLSTNDVRKATTQGAGNYKFSNLPLGAYSLTVGKSGFESQSFNSIAVQAGQTTDLKATLKVGATSQTVEVTAEAVPLVNTTTNTIATTVTSQQVENLPLSGRDITQLARLMPGYNGTWNGLPTAAQGNNVDGVVSSTSRMKFGGNASPQVAVRLENIQEMSVQTDSLDMNQGFGNSAIQLNFSTRRGTNAFHGRVFWDHRNAALNANSWTNNARGLDKAALILNDFGGSIGGPIFRDKLFFFGSFSMTKQPSGLENSANILTPLAQTGMFSYGGHTVDLLHLAATNGLPSAIHPVTANALTNLNAAAGAGALTSNPDPNLNTLSWVYSRPNTIYYPTVRLDYNATQNVRMNFSYNQQKSTTTNGDAPDLPGDTFQALTAANTRNNSYTAGYGLDWTISPTVINQFRGGYLYYAAWFSDGFDQNSLLTLPHVEWSEGISGLSQYPEPNSRYFPNFNAQDTVSLQKGAHALNFGVSYWREQDHYWDPPGGWANYNLGINANDPANGIFNATNFPGANGTDLTRARNLYAQLVGRVNTVTGRYAYSADTGDYITDTFSKAILNELQTQWGLFAQDSWRLRPSLTVNLGLRWDFVGANHDLAKQYHSGAPEDLFGPSGVGNLFNPGSLQGTNNPILNTIPSPYEGWNVTPQPMIGIAWNPHASNGFMSKLLGGDATVVRAGYSLRRFVEPQQFFWNEASNYGAFYYQSLRLDPGTDFAAGDLTLAGNPGANTLPLNQSGNVVPWHKSPSTYLPSAPVSNYTFNSGTVLNGFNNTLDQPYTQSWNFGIQRRLGASRVLELRYNGNRTMNHWLAENINEVNVFATKPGSSEKSFVDQFKDAQNNLAINGGGSFQYNGLPGQVPTPVFDAAFAGALPTNGYGNSQFIQYLEQGQAGALANTLAGAGAAPNPNTGDPGARYFCNLVGAGFSPCATNLSYTGAGAGYPINYFQANPYKTGEPVRYLTDGGYATYNGLQVDFRQQPWHGLQFDANYTWSKNLGVEPGTDWEGNYVEYSLRDLHASYVATGFDRRHVFHFAPMYDLPFGKGRAFANQGGIVDKLVGGWTVSSIITFQTGTPYFLTSGYQTFNFDDRTNLSSDSGVVLNGITKADLQNSVGVYRVDPAAYGDVVDFVNLIDPKFIEGGLKGNANPAFIQPATTPGQFGQHIQLYGPHQTFADMAVSKAIPITERVRFKFQAEFLNAFNHPVFGLNPNTDVNVIGGAFGQAVGTVGANQVGSQTVSGGTAARQIEFRANIEF